MSYLNHFTVGCAVRSNVDDDANFIAKQGKHEFSFLRNCLHVWKTYSEWVFQEDTEMTNFSPSGNLEKSNTDDQKMKKEEGQKRSFEDMETPKILEKTRKIFTPIRRDLVTQQECFNNLAELKHAKVFANFQLRLEVYNS